MRLDAMGGSEVMLKFLKVFLVSGTGNNIKFQGCEFLNNGPANTPGSPRYDGHFTHGIYFIFRAS
jgi:hypothetical protein